jgi:hypothetical protein
VVHTPVISVTHLALGASATPLSVQEIGCYRITVLAISRDGVAPSSSRLDPALLHEPHHPFARTGHALLGQLSLDTPAAVDLVTGLMHLLDAACQDLIDLRVLAEGAPFP